VKHLEHCDFGYEYAGEMKIVAVEITADGTLYDLPSKAGG